MIIKTNTGVKVLGTLARDPEIKEAKNGNLFMSLNIKSHSTKDESGKWNSTFVECTVWRNVETWDGLLEKGDAVEVFGRELKSREANGKTYWGLEADGVFVGGLVTARWVQQVIDMMQEASPTGGFSEVEEPTPFDDGRDAPKNDFQSEADKLPAQTPAPVTDDESRVIDDDAEDLPF